MRITLYLFNEYDPVGGLEMAEIVGDDDDRFLTQQVLETALNDSLRDGVLHQTERIVQ